MMTTITGKLWNADGTEANGTACVSWIAFQTHGVTIVGGQKVIAIIEGDFSVELYPNITAFPKGMYYTVRMELDSGSVYEEYWVVPDVPAATIEQVRSTFPLEPGMAINPSQIAGSGAEPGMILAWNGSYWEGSYVKVDNVSPNWIRMAAGASGNDVNIAGSPVSLGQEVTIHIPSASATARGLVTTGAQTFAGDKSFTGLATIASLASTDASIKNVNIPTGGRIQFPDGTTQNTAALTRAQYQTPWTQNVDAAGFSLSNAGSLDAADVGLFRTGIKRWRIFPDSSATLSFERYDAAGSNLGSPFLIGSDGVMIVRGAAAIIENALAINSTSGTFSVGPSARNAVISVPEDGAFNTGAFVISTKSAGAAAERLRISGAAVQSQVLVESKSGGFKFPDGTVQITAGLTSVAATQTPWVQNVTAAGFSLTFASHLHAISNRTSLDRQQAQIRVESTGVFGSGIQFSWGSDAAQLYFNGVTIHARTGDGNSFCGFTAAQIESNSGGFKFPDGTVQTSAAIQTPWLQNINANGKILSNPLKILINQTTDTGQALQVTGAGVFSVYCYAPNLMMSGVEVTPPQTFGPAAATASASYTAVPIEIREVNYVKNTQTGATYAPRIAFNWSGNKQTQLGMDYAGTIRTYDSAGTAYAPFAAALIESKLTGFKFPDGTTQASAATRILNNATSIATRPALNFIAGVNIQVTAADDAANNRVNVTITGSSGGVVSVPDTRQVIAGTGLTGGGALSADVTLSANIPFIQTPWKQLIDAAGWELTNAGRITVTGDSIRVGNGTQAYIELCANDAYPAYSYRIQTDNGSNVYHLLRSGTNGAYLWYTQPSGVAFKITDTEITSWVNHRLLAGAAGAGIWYDGATASNVAFVGMNGTSNTNFRFYSPAAGNFINIDLPTGNVTCEKNLAVGGNFGIGAQPTYQVDIYKVNATGIGPDLVLRTFGGNITEQSRIGFIGGGSWRNVIKHSLDGTAAGVLEFFAGLNTNPDALTKVFAISTAGVHSYGNVGGATFNGLAIQARSAAPGADQIMRSSEGGYLYTGYIYATISPENTMVFENVYASNDNFIRKCSKAWFSQNLVLWNAPDKAAFVGGAKTLDWRAHGQNHVIFDASSGFSPSGTGVPKKDAAAAWTEGTAPTLMGWTGAATYGVRVDVCRYADTAGSASSAGSVAWGGVTGVPSIIYGASYANQTRLVIASNVRSGGYGQAPIEVRETNYSSTTDVVQINSPRIAFHYSGRGAVQVGLDFTDANGACVYNSDCSTYGSFYGLALVGKAPNYPALAVWQTLGAVDEKRWQIHCQGQALTFSAVNDSNSAATNWLEVYRAGYTCSGATFRVPVTIAGQLQLGASGGEGGEMGWHDTSGAYNWIADVDSANILRIRRAGSVYLQFLNIPASNRNGRLSIAEANFAGSYASDAAAHTAGLARGDLYVDPNGFVRAKIQPL